MPLPKIIGVTGRKRHGKDTVGDHLVAKHGYTRMSFAEPIKEICRAVFGMSDAQLYGDDKEAADEFWGVSPRRLMQLVGTELFRDGLGAALPEVGNDLWLRVLRRKIEAALAVDPLRRFVITDLRFENEARLVAEMGGAKVRVRRPSEGAGADAHPSEVAIDGLRVDLDLLNAGSLADLHSTMDAALRDWEVAAPVDDFGRICVPEGALVVLDIDDTVLTFGGLGGAWWNASRAAHATLLDSEAEITVAVMREWNAHVERSDPEPTDKASLDAFLALCAARGCAVICLTARHSCTSEMTARHMAAVGLDLPVHYSGGDDKGRVLREISRRLFPERRHVVFVDDQQMNLRNVRRAMGDEHNVRRALGEECSVICYRYKRP